MLMVSVGSQCLAATFWFSSERCSWFTVRWGVLAERLCGVEWVVGFSGILVPIVIFCLPPVFLRLAFT
jgi:hypothetical protein